MRCHQGSVAEIRLEEGQRWVQIACPPQAIPSAGQYTLAGWPADWRNPLPETTFAPLAAALFPVKLLPGGFLAAAPAAPRWQPGDALALRGPLGHGFPPLGGIRRLALAALGDTAARLLPLAASGAGEIALLCERPPAALPEAVEALPLADLPDALGWADFLALDLPAEALPTLRARLGLSAYAALPCPAYALLFTAMPCGGLADCGVCSVPARRGHKLACKDGPVFDLGELEW